MKDDACSSIEFAGVSKRFGPVTALADLDLRINPGEFVTLLGPSGSGKSTTLNLLAGLLVADAGEIRIGGRVVNRLAPDERDIAMVFQNYALYPHMTVAENLAFPLRAPRHRRPEREIAGLVQEVADSVGIGALLQRYPKEISGGQQQRVALARALIRKPRVFLLDEPLSNLDARLRIRMRHDLKTLHQRLAPTIVYVTHDQAEAMSLSDRIAIFNGGRLQQYAAPADIYKRPVNVFVANFVGEREMNLLEGTFAAARGELTFRTGSVALALGGCDGPLADLAGRKVILGFRTEDGRIEPSPLQGAMPARVVLVEDSGADRIVYLRVGEHEVTCRSPAGKTVSLDQLVGLQVPPESVYVFDPDTHAALVCRGVRHQPEAERGL